MSCRYCLSFRSYFWIIGGVFLVQGCASSGSQRHSSPSTYVLSSPVPSSATSPPLSVGIIIDSSGSMISGKFGSWGTSKLETIQATLPSFIATFQPVDEVFILTISTRPEMAQDFTNSRILLTRAVQQLRPHGNTALYDAVIKGLALLHNGQNQKKSLVLISDGVDNGSRAHRDQVVLVAEADKVPIYTIAYGDASAKSAVGTVVRTALTSERLDTNFLQTLSQRTSAAFFLVDTSQAVDEMGAFAQDFESIVKTLRN